MWTQFTRLPWATNSCSLYTRLVCMLLPGPRMRQPQGCLGLGLSPAIPHPHLRATGRSNSGCASVISRGHFWPSPNTGCCKLVRRAEGGSCAPLRRSPGCWWVGSEGMLSSLLSSAGLSRWSPWGADDGALAAATPAEHPVAGSTDAPGAEPAGEAAAPWLDLTALQAALQGHTSTVETVRPALRPPVPPDT